MAKYFVFKTSWSHFHFMSLFAFLLYCPVLKRVDLISTLWPCLYFNLIYFLWKPVDLIFKNITVQRIKYHVTPRVSKTAISGRKWHTSLFRKNPSYKFPSLELTHNHKTWALKQVNPLVRCAHSSISCL